MSLSGIPLIATAAVLTLAALAGTVVLWRRGGSWRFLFRPVTILITEALLLSTAGLLVNRSEQFYPTWASLFAAGYSGGSTFAVTPGRLDSWLAQRPDAVSGQSTAFAWQPTGWAGWGLATAPTVVVPAGYLQHPRWRYPVAVVLTSAVTVPAARAAAAVAGPVVTVFADPRANTAGDLVAGLPPALVDALRVTPTRWAVVAGLAQATLGTSVAAAAPTRFAVLATVSLAPVRPATVRPATSKTVVVSAPARARASTGHLPAGIVTASFDRPKVITAGTPDRSLSAALAWAAGELPPPLAASAPTVASLPIARRHPHRGHSPAPGTSSPVPAPTASSSFGPAPAISSSAAA